MKKYFYYFSIPVLVLAGFLFCNRVVQANYYTNIPPLDCPEDYNPMENLASDENFWYDGERFRFSFTVDKTFCTGWGINPYFWFFLDPFLSPLSIVGESKIDDPTFKFINNISDLDNFSMGEKRFFVWEEGKRYNAYLSGDLVSIGGYSKSHNVFETYIKNGWTEEKFSEEVRVFTYNYDSVWYKRRNLKTFQIDFNYYPDPQNQEINPVILIPGVLGSWKMGGEWRVDPILGTYNNLMEALISAGYREPVFWEDDPNLFTFPYDWRIDNNITAQNLKAKIQEVKAITGSDKVDLIAHSMGGIVSRIYIQSDDYQNDVDQLIFLGTPHLGSPEGYPKIEAAYFGDKPRDHLFKTIYTVEAIQHGYFSLTQYIRDQVPTVGQLLPIYDYLKDKNPDDNWVSREYSNNYLKNDFLENLNSLEQLELLEQRVDITNFVGNIASSTLRYIKVVEDPNPDDNNWEHGYPVNLDSSEEAFEAGSGDGTVPYNSASFITADYELEDTHNALPTTMQKDIIEILTGDKPEDYFDNAIAYGISRWSIFRVYSPVDFVVITPSGKRVGKDFENGISINEIENAYYTGFDDHIEFVMIPNPEDGEYIVELQGVDGGGEYTLVTSFVDNNNPESSSEVEVNSFIASGAIDNFEINYNQDEINIESDADFQKLISLTNLFYNNREIAKISAYNFLINNLEQLSDKYDKILLASEKYNIEKQLEKIIDKIEFYFQKNWISEQAKNILISNINLLINNL